MNDRVRFEDRELDETNILDELAASRNIRELNHGHTSGFSDGADYIRDRVYEALSMGVPYLGFTDHADLTGISGRDTGFYGEEAFRDFESLNYALKNYRESENQDDPLPSNSFEVYLACGMEINYDPDNEEEIQDYIDQHDLDYALLSVHHDRKGNNFGHEETFSRGVDSEALTEEYFNLLGQAAELAHEIPEIKAIAHPDRIETNENFVHDVEPEMYHDLFDDIDSYDVLPELNAKTRVRNTLKGLGPTMGGEALIKHGTPFSGGTDTHRVGRSDKVGYGVRETERRLQELDSIAEEAELQPILEDLKLEPMTVEIDHRLQLPNFRDTASRPNLPT